jgi:hypothetical protein
MLTVGAPVITMPQWRSALTIYRSLFTITFAMSRAAIVDQRYRLCPTDVGVTPRRVVIYNVSLQGLEALQPVLHFGTTLPKPLALTTEQAQTVMQITRSARFDDWIGHALELQTGASAPGGLLILPVVDGSTPHQPLQHPPAAAIWANWRTSLLVLLLILIFICLWWLENRW